MISFDFNQSLVPAAHRLSRARLAKIAKALALAVPAQATGQVAVSFVDDAEIKRLNRMYRHKDQVTDVLAFPAGAKITEIDQEHLLGDVLIDYAQAVRQAEAEDIELELVDLLIHGILHLMGFDHIKAEDAQIMFPLQDTIIANSL